MSFRLPILFLLLAGAVAFVRPQTDSVRISAGGREMLLPVRQIGGAPLIAVDALGAFLGAQRSVLPGLKRTDLRTPTVLVKFTAGNSFVSISFLTTKRSRVVQFVLPATMDPDACYAPLQDAVALFRELIDSTLTAGEVMPAPVQVAESVTPRVTSVSVEEKKNGTLVRIHLTAKVPDATRTQQMGDWIYVTLPNTECDTVRTDTSFASGFVRLVRPVASRTSTQLSLRLRGKIGQSELVQDQTSDDLLLTLIPPAPEEKSKIDSAAIRRKQMAEAHKQVVKNIEKQKKKWKLDVVVIDPGHGGHDPGAIGVIGTREKDITLGVALKLGEMIRKELPEVSVVFTRKTDRFIELYRRGQIANENEGKLFISIHCNSTERKPSSANGFEIYLLRPGKTEDAIRIAEKENDVVKLEKDYEDRYQELTEENFIILTMAQSAYVKQSERFAEMLEETMSAQMEGQRQPVKQAGFYVLVGASMPNVLVETGYLSNVKDERFLRSPAGQKKIAASILEAVKGFKNEYEDQIQ